MHATQSTVTTLNITNGDCAADTLRHVVDGQVETAKDVLHEGPCPLLEGDAWHEVRARFLSGNDAGRYQAIKEGLGQADETIAAACRRGDDIVLWFEHDLFDQLAIIRVLDLMGRTQPGGIKGDADWSLVCIGSFPEIDRFIGLGQLTTNQLATLVGTGVPVITGHLELARDAWRAYRAPDPTALVDLARQLDAARVASSEGAPVLPFLADALLRFLAEYPSTANGLSHTEQLALKALLAGPSPAGGLFAATQSEEDRPFMGDWTFFDILQRLASARVPLVSIAPGPAEAADPAFRSRLITITAAGRDVLAGKADHLRLNGIDVWRGGVHLAGSDGSPWRWDARSETLVS
jgi:hypothetical protein